MYGYCSTLAKFYKIMCVLNCREEAELEYLKVAQDLEMYGVNYFEAKVSHISSYLVASFPGLPLCVQVLKKLTGKDHQNWKAW